MQIEQLKSYDDQQTMDELQLRERPYGRLIILARHRSGEPKYILGPHWPLSLIAISICFCMIATLFYNYFQRFSLLWNLILLTTSTLFLSSFIYTVLSNPGISIATSKPRKIDIANPRYCAKCQIVRQRKTEHCYDCDVCIKDLDHHCPWVGKCVGKHNLKAFYVFLTLTFVNMIAIFIGTTVSNLGRVKHAKLL